MPEDLDEIIQARIAEAVTPLLRRIEDMEAQQSPAEGEAMLRFYGTFFSSLISANDRSAFLDRMTRAAALQSDEVSV